MRALALTFAAALVACQSKPRPWSEPDGAPVPKLAATALIPANGVYVVDGTGPSPNVFNGSNPFPVTVASGTVGAAPSSAGTGVTPAATLVVKATPGLLRSIYAMNRNAAARYLYIENSASAVSGTSNLVLVPIYLPPVSAVIVDQQVFSENGLSFSTGISLGVSTSNTTFTAGTAADHDLAATYN